MTHDQAPTADAVPVASLGLDEFETGLLAVLRHFLTAFSRPESQAWQSAFRVATERWDLAGGPQIAMGLLPVLQALRGARRQDFIFTDPLCIQCRMQATGCEAAFMRMVQAMRRDRTDIARGAVLELTGGRMEAGLVQAGLAFAARWPATRGNEANQPDLRQTHFAPAHRHLRIVH
ncbi:hypothetical protein [Szabonella alba]|uniref:Uncharacterized protein n=1 Tax=Szabonella alba TaxID=2804194 RepID=A0A8K0V813_9RHOB|nr:hypothetical protein [Szabonella alba]MBL4916841.1 hypothetical protein [Szabonella alba]